MKLTIFFLLICNSYFAQNIKYCSDAKGVEIQKLKDVSEDKSFSHKPTYQLNDTLYNGEIKSCFPNGTLHMTCSIVKGKYHGKQICYSNGSVRSIAYYINGQLEGKVEFYDVNGKIWRTEIYKKDKLVSCNGDCR